MPRGLSNWGNIRDFHSKLSPSVKNQVRPATAQAWTPNWPLSLIARRHRVVQGLAYCLLRKPKLPGHHTRDYRPPQKPLAEHARKSPPGTTFRMSMNHDAKAPRSRSQHPAEARICHASKRRRRGTLHSILCSGAQASIGSAALGVVQL